MEFTLFTRSGCPLCDAMEEELLPYIETCEIVVRREYIDNKPALESRYGSRIPVLVHDGDVVCEYFLDPDKLKQVMTGTTMNLSGQEER